MQQCIFDKVHSLLSEIVLNTQVFQYKCVLQTLSMYASLHFWDSTMKNIVKISSKTRSNTAFTLMHQK